MSNVVTSNNLTGRDVMDTPTAGVLLREVARLHAHSQREQVACCNGTTSTQCLILTEVGRNSPLTLADLGRRTSLDKGWLSRAVETLVQEGLLTKALGDAALFGSPCLQQARRAFSNSTRRSMPMLNG